MSFANSVKFLRKELGLTQEELGQRLSISRSTIAGYETERKEPDHETLLKFADFFNVSTDYLLGKSNIKAPAPTTAALHRADGYDENLPPEAQKELADYIEFLKHKYGKK
jgi:transcriptional regulator with XRE-family HTH domain